MNRKNGCYRLAGLLLLLLSSQMVNAATIIATPGALNFGSVESGQQSAFQQITLTNTDTAYDVDITGMAIGSGFIENNTCPDVLTFTNPTCTVNVAFTPNAVGVFSDTFRVDYEDVSNTIISFDTVDLSGIGTPPVMAVLSVTPSSISFGDTVIGQSSATQTVTISNTGNEDMDLYPLVISGSFSQTNNCGNALVSGQSCTAVVTFNPTLIGNANSALEISGFDVLNSMVLTQTVNLLGVGIPIPTASLSVTPGMLGFDNVALNQQSAGQALAITNPNATSFMVDEISINGPFTQSNNCGSVIPPSGSCVIDIIFVPDDAGSFVGELAINGFDARGMVAVGVVVPLSGSTMGKSAAEEILSMIDTSGNPNLGSMITVISDTCTSGRASDQLQEDCNALIEAAAEQDPGASNALREITPERATKAPRLSHQSGLTQIGNVANRLVSLQSGAAGNSLSGLRFDINGKIVSASQLPGNVPIRGGSAGEEGGLLGSKLGGWVSGTISIGEKDGTDLDSGLDFRTSGLTVGLDYRVNEQFVLGGALGYMSTDSDLDNRGGSIDARGYSLTAYGTYLGTKTFFMDFSLTYGSNAFDQKRNLNYTLLNQGVVNQTAKASYDGDMLVFTLGSGYDFNTGGWTFGPRMHLDYIKVDVDGYTEKMSDPGASGGGWATRFSDTDQTWLTLKMGGKATYAHGTPWGVLTPYIGADWLHEFKDDSLLIDGGLTGDPGSLNFQIRTDDSDKNYFSVNLGIGILLQNGIIGFVDYKTVLSNDRWDRQVFNVGLRMEF